MRALKTILAMFPFVLIADVLDIAFPHSHNAWIWWLACGVAIQKVYDYFEVSA